ncbi:MAG: outer membrane protein transport protein [Terracidiphilus sp.]|nr:outer membrane protein transport protein [Terracidiphilus sp.]
MKYKEIVRMNLIVKRILPVAFALVVIVNSSFASDGYFLTGYGTKQQGQGGAGVAKPGDSLAGATNPAGLTLVGSRFDVGLTLFRPVRYGTITGNQLPPGYPNVNGTYDGNRVKNFELPELGYSRQARPNLTWGVAIYGNGGMNTSYTKPIPLLGSTRGGVNIEQVFISPTLAYKLGKHNSFGIAANIDIQRFAAEGLQNFANSTYSTDPANVTNTGHSYGAGGGVRVGWLGELNRYVNVGATYQSRTYVSKFNRYKGLFAEQGGFDVPANFAGGVAVKLGPKATLLYDEERILLGQIKSNANSDANQAQLGSNNGPGFGWHDINVIKTGLAYDLSPSLTLRGGYNHSGVPFDASQTFFNLLAPAVTKDHLHVGATIALKGGKEINLAYIHAFDNTVNGVNSIAPANGGGNANLRMYQNSFQVGFGWKKDKK